MHKQPRKEFMAITAFFNGGSLLFPATELSRYDESDPDKENSTNRNTALVCEKLEDPITRADNDL